MRTKAISISAAMMCIALVALDDATTASLAQAQSDDAQFTADGQLIRPDGWREWVYVGTPLTPNPLNGGQAPFPEFHSVYIDPASWEHWRRTGEFREGTMLAKELSLVHAEGAHDDGSTDQVSGAAAIS